MAARPVKVSFVADTADLRADLKKVESSFDGAASSAKSAGSKIDSSLDSTAEAADGVASKGSQAAGALTGLGDLIGGKFGAAMMTAGVAFQAAADGGDLLNVVTESNIVRKVKDTAVTVAQTTATIAKTAADKAAAAASKAWAGAQWLLNAALAANPIGLLVIAIAALVAAFVIAYQKSETFKNIVDAAFSAIQKVISNVLPAVKNVVINTWDAIKTATSAAWGFVKDKVIGPLQDAWGRVKDILGDIKSGVGNAWDDIKTKTRNVFDGVKELITGPFGDVVKYIKDVPGKIRELGADFKNAGEAVMGKIIDGIKGAAGFIGDIGNSIWEAVKKALNAGIDKINSALEFTISLPGKDIKIDPPNIPHLATGGITTGRTLAVIGDNPGGREAVIPLNRNGGGPLVDAVREALNGLKPATGTGAPLIGNVTQSPGESAEGLAQRLYLLTRSRG